MFNVGDRVRYGRYEGTINKIFPDWHCDGSNREVLQLDLDNAPDYMKNYKVFSYSVTLTGPEKIEDWRL